MAGDAGSHAPFPQIRSLTGPPQPEIPQTGADGAEPLCLKCMEIGSSGIALGSNLMLP